jgi:hypothetical protein
LKRCALLLACCALLRTPLARAEPPDPLIDPSLSRNWDEGATRVFVATQADVGGVYARPQLSLGYGQPFASFVGFDFAGQAQMSGFGGYAGLRAAIPGLELRFGPRLFRSSKHDYLPEQASYDRVDLERDITRHALTTTLESELSVQLKLGPGELSVRETLHYLSGVPSDDNVYDEQLYVIVKPPLVWSSRLAYQPLLSAQGAFKIGPAVELIHLPGRHEAVFRAGLLVNVTLSRHLELRATLLPALVSPDRVGGASGDFSELGLRYRWASQ